MNRIDFHIHTVETASDSSGFNFDIEVLKDYVEGAHLAAIAITNHNGFYRDNYDQVSKALDIAVFPGAEINVTKLSGFGHVIIVADPADIDDFASGMATLAGECPGSSDHMSWERVVELFPKISNWLIIPHYKKSKKLDSATLSHIQSTTGYDALEVANAKKWLVERDGADAPLVVFSDCRPGLRMPDEDPDDNIRRYAYGYTYLQCNEMSFSSIKAAFANANNVEIFPTDRDFEILPEALPASRRMNVILGERSSGKTFTLKRILDAYEPEDRLYIEQFEITNKAKKDIFDKNVAEEDSVFFDNYFNALQDAINHYTQFDQGACEDAVRAYCTALVQFAAAPTDRYSERPIYNADEFTYEKSDAVEASDVKLRKAARELADGGKRPDVVKEYVDPNTLRALDSRLRELMKQARTARWQKKQCDAAVAEIKKELCKKSARKPLPQADQLREYFKYCYREKRLVEVLDALATPLDLKSDEEYKYLKKRTRQMYSNATEARKGCGLTLPSGTDVAGLFGAKVTSAKRLAVIRSFDATVQTAACRLLFNIKSRIVLNDESSAALSGGQRAEYLLLHRIAAAAGKDVVLIDEPESSFDNPFLNHDVITLLNDVAEHATVFLVTHNNTLGVSLLPDCIIYTEKTKSGEYRVYSGELSATKLIDAYGNTCDRKEVMLDTMEAGRIAYLERRTHYGLA